MSDDPLISRRYAYYNDKPYRGNPKSPKTSAYLVEVYSEGNVVARITHLGGVNTIAAEQEVAIELLKRGLSIVGAWRPAKRGKQQKARAVLGTYEGN